MTRALPAPPRPRETRRLFRWPTFRRTTVSLIRVDTITVEPHELAGLRANPNVQVIHARLVGPYLYKAVVRWPDRAAPAPKRQAPIAFEWNRHALRALREVGTAIGLALTWLFAVGAAVVVTAGLVWHLFGDELTAAGKILLAAGGGVAALIVLTWLLSAKAGVCPGLHCPGCPHR